MSPETPTSESARVVIVSDADVMTDLRVRTVARTLSEAGADVVALGPATAGERAVQYDGRIRFVQVPVDYVVRRRMGRPGKGKQAGAYGFLSEGTRDRLVLARSLREIWERKIETRVARLRVSADRMRRERSRMFSAPYRVLVAVLARVLVLSVELLRTADEAGVELLRRRRSRSVKSKVQLPGARLRELGDLEAALGPTLDELRPDVIHAVGFRMLPLAEAAVARAAADGRRVRHVYDARVDVRTSLARRSRDVAFAQRMEAEHVREAAAIIASTEQLSGRLVAAHGLQSRPAVVPDAPPDREISRFDGIDLSVVAGLGERARVVCCLLPLTREHPASAVLSLLRRDLHVIVLSRHDEPAVIADLLGAARDEHLDGRLHVVTDPGEVGRRRLFEQADVGVLLPGPEVGREAPTLAVLDALHAGIPVACPEQSADAVLSEQIEAGRSYRAGGADAIAEAVDAIFADSEVDLGDAGRTDSLEPFTWETHAPALVGAYRELLGDRLSPHVEGAAARTKERLGIDVEASDAEISGIFGIGPRNGNGMPWEWSQALRSAFPNVEVEVFGVQFDTGRLQMAHPCHRTITLDDWLSLDWQLGWTKHVLSRYSHILIEQGLSVLGRLNGRHFFHDLPTLRQHGITVGLVFRGSEIRDPARHAARERFSPFRDPTDEFTARLQGQVDRLRPHVETFDGPVFVTTLDLKDDLPHAEWLPHTIDTERWRGSTPVLERDVPVVVHAPSKERMKGSAFVDDVCMRLAEGGKIEYRRLRGIPFDEMPATLRAADVVIDQFALGSYGVLAAQAMAAGRVVIGHVSDHVRGRLPVDLPIVEADPDTLEDVLVSILDDRESAIQAAPAGVSYVERFHSGAYAAGQLAHFLGLVDRYSWASFFRESEGAA